MAKTRKPRPRSTRARKRGFEAIPLAGITPAEERLALKFDTLVTSATVNDRQIKAMQPKIIGAKVRGGYASGRDIDRLSRCPRSRGLTPSIFLAISKPRAGRSRPTVGSTVTIGPGGNGVANSSRDTGGLFAYAAAATTDPVKFFGRGRRHHVFAAPVR